MKTTFTSVRKKLVLGAVWLGLSTVCFSQNDVMLQAFYWNVPVDQTNLNGSWWDTLRVKTPEL
ncbi:MAG TPA: hypothetical protein VIH57_02540, partial [Bacteroidales bacterium]